MEGADADIALWDPQATKTITKAKQKSKGDFNIFEGRTVRGVASHTVSQGQVVWADGELRVERGAGRYVKRPAFGTNFTAAALRTQDQAPRLTLPNVPLSTGCWATAPVSEAQTPPVSGPLISNL